MKYIFELNHPKHYYQFREVMNMLRSGGHTVQVLARDKDVLLNVLNEEGVPYIVFGLHRKSLLGKVLGAIGILFRYFAIVLRQKPDVIISKASFYGTFTAWIFRKKSVIFPDSEVVKVTNRYVVPLSSMVVTPATFGLDYGSKHRRVKGFFEDCYLHPKVFTADRGVLASMGSESPYALLRFVGWFANHDVGQEGMTQAQRQELISLIENEGLRVYISAEGKLPEDMKRYELPTPKSAIHSVLAFASLYVGDSQTMATEAALLGTPAIRSNSFVGDNDMTNFKVLERRYSLLRNVRSFDDVLHVVKELCADGKKDEWQAKRVAYYSEIGDINSEIVGLLLNV